MTKSIRRNPTAFTPLPVTITTAVVYAALLTTLLVLHLVVPAAPRNRVPFSSIDLNEAWRDLKTLSNGFHPYNSRRNDAVRDWLLHRLDDILEENNVSYSTWGQVEEPPSSDSGPVVIFNDMLSNLSSSYDPVDSPGISTYFEGTNIIVYIRGTEDQEGNWWASNKLDGRGGVLVNAHYDSVSTGYGATDDGVGVVSILQLIKYFSTPGNQPKRGIIALLNNGEEDFLNGARVFARHPASRFPHTFLNLEGAGSGGRATIFRSTDTEVARFYRGTKNPFGTVVSADGFKRGLVRSQTDYIVFDGNLGMRGLDVAFMEPRARYHTDEDDTKHSSINSLWHMLSAALHTVRGLVHDTSSTFEGNASGKNKVHAGTGSDSVWFDILGQVFVVFELHTLFALSVTLLIAAPIFLIITGVVVAKQDKFYLFSLSKSPDRSEENDSVSLYGFRGFFRYPIIFAAPAAGLVGLAYLLTKVNPFIVYSSPYAVWAMMLSAWVFVTWFLSRAADFVRPTAFQRAYSLLWMFIGGWALLVIATVYQERLRIASGYPLIFYFAAIATATMITFLEQLSLVPMTTYVEGQTTGSSVSSSRPQSNAGNPRRPSSTNQGGRNGEEVDENVGADETTSLLGSSKKTTFANYTSNQEEEGHPEHEDPEAQSHDANERLYDSEQQWSDTMVSWLWVIQFLLLGPFIVIVVGQIGLLVVSASYQTLADGSSALMVYLMVAIFSVLIMSPLGPFIHRVTYHIPTFLLAVFIGTLVYNLVAFPFSANNRLKVFFVQRVDLDTGINEVALGGVRSSFMDEIVNSIPSAVGQEIGKADSVRADLVEYTWRGPPPLVVPNTKSGIPPAFGYSAWLEFNVTRSKGAKQAQFFVRGKNTRSCKIVFKEPISDFDVQGSDLDSRFPKMPSQGSSEIRLWSREWEKLWRVDVEWEGEGGIDGKVTCMWNDDGLGSIPALEEIKRFAPDWATVSKLGDGLVEGTKVFLA